MAERKYKRDRKTKKTACGKQAHKANHINTDWRKEGWREKVRREQSAVRQTHIGNQVSFWELKGQRGQSVHVCACVLNRLRPLESPRSAKQRRGR